MSERTRSCQEMTPEDEEWLVDAPGPEVWAGLPRSRWEDGDLLRRLDDWREGEDAGPLIRWAAVHLRGCKNEGGDPSATALVSGAPQLDASALSSQKQRKPNTPGWLHDCVFTRQRIKGGFVYRCRCGALYEEMW